MTYTEHDVFVDCTKDSNYKEESGTYKEIWLAFCKWIIELFEKGRGVSILNFMTLAWIPDQVKAETTVSQQEKKFFRPVWRMAQTFESAFHVSCKNKSDRRSPDDADLFCKVCARYWALKP